jgi:hypothetical protein
MKVAKDKIKKTTQRVAFFLGLGLIQVRIYTLDQHETDQNYYYPKYTGYALVCK